MTVFPLCSSSLVGAAKRAANVSDTDVLLAPGACNHYDDNRDGDGDEGNGPSNHILGNILGPEYVAALANRLDVALGPMFPINPFL